MSVGNFQPNLIYNLIIPVHPKGAGWGWGLHILLIILWPQVGIRLSKLLLYSIAFIVRGIGQNTKKNYSTFFCSIILSLFCSTNQKTYKKPHMHQHFVKSEPSVRLHSSLSLFVFLQTAIGCWTPSDDCNRRGKSRRNAVQPLCLSYSLILLTLSLCCGRQDKQTGHSCSIQHRLTGDRHVCFLMWWISKTKSQKASISQKKKNGRMNRFQISIPGWTPHWYTLHFL